ncbi:RING finger protein 37-like [Hyalella azteca]|uniref:RING finger protein 37-like n=1 Tax=Hyalella azteca TaxID=294128 RepID=A0A8B7NZU9_HYAAZ|nr:RING finger protein 37-like [Hyalella azteca]
MNFCLSQMQTRLHCESPSADEYNLENLIHNQASIRSKGFLTEGFVRPPVNIDFIFKVPVDVFHIFFDTKVFYKQCCAFAVFMNCHPRDEASFVKVGWYNTNNEECIHLTSAHCDKWHQYPAGRKRWRLSQTVSVFEGRLRSPDRRDLKNVRCLRIRLLRNVSTGGSGLRNVEVWGQVGDLASLAEKQALLNCWQVHLKSQLPNELKLAPSSDLLQHSTSSSISNGPFTTKNIDDDDIPEEFLDPITCEVMVTPMLLPSGHSVDISTLDKFNAAEMCYNRPPSNPFTGIAYTSDRKPIPNVGLKTRIDRFMTLHHCSSAGGCISLTKKSTATSGSARNNFSVASASGDTEQATNAGLVTLTGQKRQRSFESEDGPSLKSLSSTKRACSSVLSTPANTNSNNGGHQGLPRLVSRPSSCVTVKKYLSTTSESYVSNPCNSNRGVVPITRGLLNVKPAKLIRGDGLKPEFTDFSSERLLQGSDECAKCLSRGHQLYILSPCEHLMCRSCLTGTEAGRDVICSQCETAVPKSQISKYYSQSAFAS